MEEQQQPPEGLPPEFDRDLETLCLVSVQSKMKEIYEGNWQDPNFSTSSLLRRLLKDDPISKESQEFIKEQAVLLMKAKEEVKKIVNSGKNNREIFAEALPDLPNPPVPLEIEPRPYSLHFRFAEEDFDQIAVWAIDEYESLSGFKKEETKKRIKIGGMSLYSGEYEMRVSLSFGKGEQNRESRAHEQMHDFINTVYPGELLDWDKFYADFDYAMLCLKSVAKGELTAVVEEATHKFPRKMIPLSEYWKMEYVVTHYIQQIKECFGSEAEDEMKRFYLLFAKNYRAVQKYLPVLSRLALDYAPLTVAILDYDEIHQRFPRIGRIFAGMLKQATK